MLISGRWKYFTHEGEAFFLHCLFFFCFLLFLCLSCCWTSFGDILGLTPPALCPSGFAVAQLISARFLFLFMLPFCLSQFLLFSYVFLCFSAAPSASFNSLDSNLVHGHAAISPALLPPAAVIVNLPAGCVLCFHSCRASQSINILAQSVKLGEDAGGGRIMGSARVLTLVESALISHSIRFAGRRGDTGEHYVQHWRGFDYPGVSEDRRHPHHAAHRLSQCK